MTDTPTRPDYRAMSGPELARAVMDVIEDNQERFYQGTWRKDIDPNGYTVYPGDTHASSMLEAHPEDPLHPACRTSLCVAGWVAALDRVKWMYGNPEHVGDPERCDCLGKFCRKEEHQVQVGVYARDRLGLDLGEAETLFHGDNSLQDVRDYIEQYIKYGGITDDRADPDEDDDED